MKILSIIITSLLVLPSAGLATVYVSPNGNDAASGREEAPVCTIERALEIVARDQADEPKDVCLMDGVYWRDQHLMLGPGFSGQLGHPARLRAANAGRAVIKSGVAIPLTQFIEITDPSRTALLQPVARPNVRVAVLSKQVEGESLFGVPGRVILHAGVNALSEARWPDSGFANSYKVIDPGVVWAAGRSPGSPPKSDFAHPIGAEFTLHEHWKGNWAAEMEEGVSQPQVFGYFANDWFYQNDRLARANGEALKLVGHGRYAFGSEKSIPRRVFVVGLLSELDRPGEWFWDSKASSLYLWPLSANEPVDVPGRITLLQVEGASHVSIEGIVFESAARAVDIRGGEDVRVAGCMIRNLSDCGVTVVGGRNHEVISCDIHDVDVPINIRGAMPADYRWEHVEGRLRPVSDGHKVVNNHIYDCRNERGMQIHGVGILLSHNLVHDLRGSALTWGGNDLCIEYNEFYSLLTELGDWGVTYTGASWTSHGNVLRYNFVHHVFGVPASHPVNGFYFDDLDQGDITFGNIFYKCGYRAVMINGGAAQTVTNNLFIKNYVNVYVTAGQADKYRAERAEYDAGRLHRGDKTDYYWRTAQITGPEGWKRGPWAEAYPDFAHAMALDPFSPVLTTIARNRSQGALDRDVWLKAVPAGMVKPERMTKVPSGAFVDPESLDFRFKPGFNPGDGFEPIPFERIGLVADAFRPNPPDKATYRRALRRLFADRPAYDPAALYLIPQS